MYPNTQILERIGNRWALMILDVLDRSGTLRYNEIRRAVDGIPQRMLTLNLRHLERDGLLERKSRATIPPWVDYELTALGSSLTEQLSGLHGWVREHRTAILAARKRFEGSQP